jgi:hypothetical protein
MLKLLEKWLPLEFLNRHCMHTVSHLFEFVRYDSLTVKA